MDKCKEGQGQNVEAIKSKCRDRCRRRLSVYLHTHVVLIVVCSLAILDAVCVIGQLISDILIMKEKLNYFEEIDEDLTPELLRHLLHLNSSTHDKWNLHAILAVLQGWDIHSNAGPLDPPGTTSLPGSIRSFWNTTLSTAALHTTPRHTEDNVTIVRIKRAVEVKVPGHEVDHGLLYELTHTFHLGSMAILSLLLLETMLKVLAMGKKLKHHKLEIFDALIVSISWALDVGLSEGIWAHPGSQAATFLMYLLPWRVIRIVNSFVLVIQEKEHVHLKIVKQRLRQSLKKSKEALEKASSYRHEVKALAGMCRKLGASESEITACSPSGKAGRRGSVQSVLERAASLTFISTMSSMGSLPSLFDMGGSSSDEEEDREQNLEGGRGRKLTLRSALSSDTLDSNSGNLDTEDAQSYQNLENDTSRSRSTTIDKDVANEEVEEEEVVEKAEVERTDSNSSVPPEYFVAVATDGSDTRL
ncbi:hypothetical protein BsWGS_07905 [Bradybaena similaris]